MNERDIRTELSNSADRMQREGFHVVAATMREGLKLIEESQALAHHRLLVIDEIVIVALGEREPGMSLDEKESKVLARIKELKARPERSAT